MLAGSAVLKSLLQPGCMARLAGGHAAHLLHSRRGTIADSDCLLDCFGRCAAWWDCSTSWVHKELASETHVLHASLFGAQAHMLETLRASPWLEWPPVAACAALPDTFGTLACLPACRSLLLKVVLPCTLAYVLELSARRTFCKCVSHTGVVRT